MRFFKKALTVLLAAAAFSAADGATYYVDVSYDGAQGAGNGTINQPYTNIGAAVTAANAADGNVILVADGTYKPLAAGGFESFGANGLTFTRTTTIRGGYVGQVSGATFDWSDSTRVIRSSVIDLAGAGTRAFYNVTGSKRPVVDGFAILNGSVAGATTAGSGGAICFSGGFGSAGSVVNCLLSNNVATVNGGALYVSGNNSGAGNALITNCLFIGNRAGNGGGIYIDHYSPNYIVEDSRFEANLSTNTAWGSGGGGFYVAAGADFSRCSFVSNEAAYAGGGVGGHGSGNLRRSVFIGNQAGSGGGSAIGANGYDPGVFLIENCLIYSNTGPGFAVASIGSEPCGLTIRHSTIVNNPCGAGAAGTSASGGGKNGDLEVRNSIIANNGTNAVAVGLTTDDTTPVIDYNNIYGHGSNYAGLAVAGPADLSTNALFADEASGGFRLLKGSPCVDAAVNLGAAQDLEGGFRPTRYGFDMGCYEEYQIPLITNRVVIAQPASAEVRAEFVVESTGIVTYAWLVLDTTDKGTNMADWAAFTNAGPQVQGVVFSAGFDGLSPETTYAFRCMASNDYDVWWGPVSTFKTPAAGGVTRLWTGAGTNRLASLGANWDGGVAPGASDYILLDTASTTMIWDAAAPATVARWTQTENFTGIVTVETVYGSAGFTNFTVTGDCLVNGGTLMHRKNASTPVYRLRLSVGGDLAVGPKGRISGNGVGYLNNSGPGVGNWNPPAAGSHGGQGARKYIGNGNTYGSVSRPETLGSGGVTGGNNDGHGGGAIRLTVAGNAAIEGLVEANAFNATSGGNGGAGGSVLLEAASLTGAGQIQANGYGMGGGGRVAAILSVASSFGNVSMQAFGGRDANFPGSAGTVYRQGQGQAEGQGTLTIDNSNAASAIFNYPTFSYACALMPTASVWNAAVDLNAFSAIVVTNKGILGVNRDTALDWAAAAWRFAGPTGSYVSIVSTNGVAFPAALVVSNCTLLLDTPVAAAGNWTVAANGAIGCQAVDNRTQPPLSLTLDGNLTVQAGGVISAESAGHRDQNGPGVGAWSPGRGGSYGGQGGVASWSPGNTYGSFLAPTNFGSGGSSGGNNVADGGGAIRLVVSGTCTVDGTVNANAKPAFSGAGGTIHLTAGALAGAGVLTASGSAGSSGGGGRIAVTVTNGAGFGSVAMRAFGGSGGTPGAAGTVYREAALAGGRGALLIDNNGVTTTTNAVTHLPPLLLAVSNELAGVSVTVTNKARLTLTGDATVGDLWLPDSGSILDLRFKTLRVRSTKHDLGLGTVTNYGAIVWLPKGSVIVVR